MDAINVELPILQPVFRDPEPIEGIVLAGAIREGFTLHDFHDLSGFVLQLFGKYRHRKRLGDQIHKSIISHLMLSLAQGDHTPPGGLRAVGVDGGQYTVTGAGCFLRCVCLC